MNLINFIKVVRVAKAVEQANKIVRLSRKEDIFRTHNRPNQVANLLSNLNFLKRRQVFFDQKEGNLNRDAYLMRLSVKYATELKERKERNKNQLCSTMQLNSDKARRRVFLSVEAKETEKANSFDKVFDLNNSAEGSESMNSAEMKELEIKIDFNKKQLLKAKLRQQRQFNREDQLLESKDSESEMSNSLGNGLVLVERSNLIHSEAISSHFYSRKGSILSKTSSKTSSTADNPYIAKREPTLELEKRLGSSLIHIVIVTTMLTLTVFPALSTEFIKGFSVPEEKTASREKYCMQLLFSTMKASIENKNSLPAFKIALDQCLNFKSTAWETQVNKIGYINFQNSAVAAKFNSIYGEIAESLEIITEEYPEIVDNWRPEREFATVSLRFDQHNAFIYSYSQKTVSQLESLFAVIEAIVVSFFLIYIYVRFNKDLQQTVIVPTKQLIERMLLYLNHEELSFVGGKLTTEDERDEIEAAMGRFVNCLSCSLGQYG